MAFSRSALGLVFSVLGSAACLDGGAYSTSPAPASDAGPQPVPECTGDGWSDACPSTFRCADGSSIATALRCTNGRWECSVDSRRAICPAPMSVHTDPPPVMMTPPAMSSGHVFVACGAPPYGNSTRLGFESFDARRVNITSYGRSVALINFSGNVGLSSGNGVVATTAGMPYFTNIRAIDNTNGNVLMGPVALTGIAPDRQDASFRFAHKEVAIMADHTLELNIVLTITGTEERYGDVARSSYSVHFGPTGTSRIFADGDLRWLDTGTDVTADQVSYDPSCFWRAGFGRSEQFRVAYYGSDLLVELDVNIIPGTVAAPHAIDILGLATSNFGSGGGQVSSGTFTALARLDGDSTRPIPFERLVTNCHIVGNSGMVLSEAYVMGNRISSGLTTNEVPPNDGTAYSRLNCQFVWPAGVTASYIDVRVGAGDDAFTSRASNIAETSRVVSSNPLNQNFLASAPAMWNLHLLPPASR